jgi:hypothetical protein
MRGEKKDRSNEFESGDRKSLKWKVQSPIEKAEGSSGTHLRDIRAEKV